MPDRRVSGAAIAARFTLGWLAIAAFFGVTGGDLRWWHAWAWCAAIATPMAAFVAHAFVADPDFLARRLQPREPDPRQAAIQRIGAVPLLAALVLPGLAHRYGAPTPPWPVVAAALTVAVLGYLLVLRVFFENRWAARTVQVFDDQRVIDTGPYAWVRHPMYVGAIAMFSATPLALGSWWGVPPALAFVPVLMYRAVQEERTLIRQLPGYEAYVARVRYRLLPGVW